MNQMMTHMDREMFEGLIRSHQAQLFRYLRYLGADNMLAEDLVQDTFLQVFKGGYSPPDENPDKSAAWLRGVALNTGEEATVPEAVVAEATLEEKLNQEIEVNFEGVLITEICDYIREQADINIILDQYVDKEARLTLLGKYKVKSALNVIAKFASGDVFGEKTVTTITGLEAAQIDDAILIASKNRVASFRAYKEKNKTLELLKGINTSKITVHCDDTPAKEIINILAKQQGFNIAYGNDLDYPLSLGVNDMKTGNVLEVIAWIYWLNLREEDGILYLEPMKLGEEKGESTLTGQDINAQVAQIDIGKSSLEEVIKVFGEPMYYVWNKEIFTKENLPERYIVIYPNRMHNFAIYNGVVAEVRFESDAAGYVFRDKIRIGSSLDEVLAVIGQPVEALINQKQKDVKYANGVLYQDIDGIAGYSYYGRKDQGVRMFFRNNRVNAIYLTGNQPASNVSKGEEKAEAVEIF